MVATNKNLAAFDTGIRKALQKMKSSYLSFGIKVAKDLIDKATQAYMEEEASLTGNLLNSIAGGVYVNKSFEAFVTNDKIQGITHTYTRVGDKGFRDYDTGEIVEVVKQYKGKELKFIPAPRGERGVDSALEFLSSYRPVKSALEIVICAAAPYASFLQQTRGLDVLTTAYQEAGETWNTYKYTIKPI